MTSDRNPSLKEALEVYISRYSRFHLDGVFIFVFVVFTLWYVNNVGGGLGVDEAVYAPSGYLMVTGKDLYVNLQHPPLAKYFIGIFEVLIGINSFGARISSAIFALLTLVVVYALCARLWSRTVGLFAVVFLGVTPLFASFAVIAMLDMTLVFFCTLLLLFYTIACRQAVFWKYALVMGAVSALAFTSKFLACFFVIPLIFGMWIQRNWDRTLKTSLKEITPFIIFFFVTTLIVYAPYLSRLTDVIGTIWYINFSHLKGGHTVMVLGEVYQKAPIYTYIVWTWQYLGLLHLIGLCIAIVYVLFSKDIVKRTIAVSGIFYFLCISLMTVKLHWYHLPVAPITSMFLFGAMKDLVKSPMLTNYMSKIKGVMRASVRDIVALALMLIILLSPLSPIYVALWRPDSINEDSGYDKAAELVLEWAERHGEAMVLSWYPHILKFYLGDQMDHYNITVRELDVWTPEGDAQTYSLLRTHTFDIAVTYIDARFKSFSKTYEYLFANSTSSVCIERAQAHLWVFYLK